MSPVEPEMEGVQQAVYGTENDYSVTRYTFSRKKTYKGYINAQSCINQSQDTKLDTSQLQSNLNIIDYSVWANFRVSNGVYENCLLSLRLSPQLRKSYILYFRR